jgi:biotin carboxylase
MSRKRIVLFGSRFAVCDRARQLGLDVFLVQTPALFDKASFDIASSAVYTEYETDPGIMPMLRAAHEAQPFDAIISTTESGLLPAARAAAALGLPGMPPPRVVERTLDKFAMRQHMAAAGFAPIAAELGHCAADVVRFADKAEYPIVVKPRDGAGSKGVMLIGSVADAALVDGMKEFLMEEYLDGPEISVETFSFDGRHRIFAITAKTTDAPNLSNRFVETGHQVPANLGLEKEHHISSYVSEFLDLMGIENGPAHTEIKLTRKGLRVVETHTRIGGDYISGLVRLVTGHDLHSLTLGWPLGLVSDPGNDIVKRGGAAIRFFVPPEGIVEDIHGVEYWKQEPGVHLIDISVKIGDHVKSVLCSDDRVGYVVATANDPDEAARLCQRVTENVRIVVSGSTTQ